jgi:hypothetical protein
MKRNFLLVSCVFSSLLAVDALAQVPALPVGIQTKWVVDEPEEIVGYLIFDPATVKEKIPSFLRFITVEELAADQILWAREHLSEYPEHADWGISFIEVVRMKTFEIHGRAPEWPEQRRMRVYFHSRPCGIRIERYAGYLPATVLPGDQYCSSDVRGTSGTGMQAGGMLNIQRRASSGRRRSIGAFKFSVWVRSDGGCLPPSWGHKQLQLEPDSRARFENRGEVCDRFS